MKIKKIMSQVLILLIIVCNMNIDTYAALPRKVEVSKGNIQSLDGGIKLTWYKYSDVINYIVKRAETKTGPYTVIKDNLSESAFEDTELDNAKTYYYKITARNADGIGEESEVIEATPSKSNYLWFEVYGHQAKIKGIDVYDTNGNKIYYTYGYLYDQTTSINNSIKLSSAGDLLNHRGYMFNRDSTWSGSTAPKSLIGLRLNPHSGIKKISVYSDEYSPIKTYIYETVEYNTSLLVDGNKIDSIGEVNFKISGKTKEYIIYKSGLQADGQDQEVFLKWNSIEGVKNYTVKKSENEFGPFTTVASDIKVTEYVDENLENQETYFYKVEGITQIADTIDLGTVYAKTTKDRYVVLELFEAYDQSSIYINELQILDSDNNVINYGVAEIGSFDQYYYNPAISICRKYRMFDRLKDNNIEDYLYIDPQLSSGEWIRYALILDENIGVDKINLWVGNVYNRLPKKVTFYTTLSYDYSDNLKLRRNDNLAFFSEKEIANTSEVIKYEFTQSAPDTPQGVNALSEDTRAKVKWNKVHNADSYKIKRSTSPGGPYTVIEENIVDLEYTDKGVINGTEYYYVVSAVNKGGESSNSLESSVIPSAKPPQAPIGLTTMSVDNAITLSWQPVYNASNYTIKRSETAGGPYETILENTSAITYSDTELAFGTTYYYVVTAQNAQGLSNNSEEVLGVPGQVSPVKPTNIITKVKDSKVYLTWDTSNHAVSYKVIRSVTKDGTYTLLAENIKGISYKDITAEADKTYFYKIVAVNGEGESEASDPIQVVVKDNTEQKILLSLTMKNGTTKEYIVTQSQLTAFMNWYQEKTENRGLSYFTVMNKNKYGAYKTSKNYILFDSILSIDLKEIQDR